MVNDMLFAFLAAGIAWYARGWRAARMALRDAITPAARWRDAKGILQTNDAGGNALRWRGSVRARAHGRERHMAHSVRMASSGSGMHRQQRHFLYHACIIHQQRRATLRAASWLL